MKPVDEDYAKPKNREKAMHAVKGHKFWCACDRNIIGEFGRCPVCGFKNNPKKRKGIL